MSFKQVIFECLTGQEAYDEKKEGSTEKKLVSYTYEPHHEKMCLREFLTRSDSNLPAQLHKLA